MGRGLVGHPPRQEITSALGPIAVWSGAHGVPRPCPYGGGFRETLRTPEENGP